MEPKALFNTREVAHFLDINEKVVYSLIAEKGLPATKVTGKWLFPRPLVERWLEAHTINFPKQASPTPSYEGLLVLSGSNDILLDRTIALFNRLQADHVAAFCNVGSRGGLRALGARLCHIAASHLLQEDGRDYNFDFASEELKGEVPAVVNFCRREQGILVAKGNPKGIRDVADLAQPGVRIANRPAGTGTRLLLDRALEAAGISRTQVEGYEDEFRNHFDVGIEVLSGRAQAAPCIRVVSELLGLDFIPLRWERFDLLISRDRFFEPAVQLFVGLLHEDSFRSLAKGLEGYDLALCGKMVFPQQACLNQEKKSTNPGD